MGCGMEGRACRKTTMSASEEHDTTASTSICDLPCLADRRDRHVEIEVLRLAVEKRRVPATSPPNTNDPWGHCLAVDGEISRKFPRTPAGKSVSLKALR